MAVLLFPQNTYDALKAKGILPMGAQRVPATAGSVDLVGPAPMPNTGVIAPPTPLQPTTQPFQDRLAEKPVNPINPVSQPMPMGGTVSPSAVPRAPMAMPHVPSAQPFSRSGQPGLPYVDQDKMAWEGLPFTDRLAFKKIFMNSRMASGNLAARLQKRRGARVNIPGG